MAALLHAVIVAGLLLSVPGDLGEPDAASEPTVTVLFEQPAVGPAPQQAPAIRIPLSDMPSPVPMPRIETPWLPPMPPARPAPARVPPPTTLAAAASAQTAPSRADQPSSDVLGRYRSALAAHLRPFEHYPPMARTLGQEGTVLVHVTILRDGRILGLAIDRGSGHESLDQAAIATVKHAEPLPPVPDAIPGPVMEFMYPVRFHLE